MRFLLDQDVPEDLSYLLRELGHEVVRVRDFLPQDATDSVVLQAAHDHGCVLVTCNRNDFIRLAERQPHLGIVVVIRRRTRAAERAALVSIVGTRRRCWTPGQHQLRLNRSSPSHENSMIDWARRPDSHP